MKRHILHAILRAVLAIGIVIALPFSHSQWGESYPGEGQKAFGFVVIFTLIGYGAAAVFVALGSLAQFILRRRSPLYTVLVDFGLFVAFAGALVYGGLTAKYVDSESSHLHDPSAGGTAETHQRLGGSRAVRHAALG